MRVVNGRAIEHYKNFEVRETGLAIPKAEPLYIPAISNGYAPNDFIVDSSLVLYLPLYLLKGSKFKSVDAYKRTATVTGAVWGPTGRLFDGTGEITPASPIVLADDTPWTIVFWLHPTEETGTAGLTGNLAVAGSQERIFIWGGGTRLYVTDRNASSVIWFETFSLTEMQHVVITCDGSDADNLHLFINTSDKGAKSRADSQQIIRVIGDTGAGGAYFKGTLGEMRVYDGVCFSQADVTHDYNATK